MIDEVNVLNDYKNGMSLTKIAIKYETNRYIITKIVRRNGLEIVNRQNIARMDENIFENIDNEEKAYWLGFLYADGYVTKNKIGIGLQQRDLNHLKKFKKFLSYTDEIRYKERTKSYKLEFSNKKMKSDLERLGVVERKSLILKYPTEEQLPSKFTRDFIRGIVDGDGHISIIGEKYSVFAQLNILGTEDIIKNIIKNLKFKELKIKKINKNGSDKALEICWKGKYVFDYLKILYEDAELYLDRKYEIYLKGIKLREKYKKKEKKKRKNYRRKIIQISLDNKVIKVWESKSSASKALSISVSCLSSACLGLQKTAGGFIWNYFDEI